MFKLIKRLLLSILILGIIFGFFYWRSVKDKPLLTPQDSEYRLIRDKLLDILNDEEFNPVAFRLFLNEIPPYRLDTWPSEFWHSITFNDPRGGITIFQDTMMGVALGVNKLWQDEDPMFDVEKKVTDIISRRAHVWHDFHWQNHYTREYAALAALTHVIGDSRNKEYKEKLHESLSKMFLSDGSSQEGTAYGFYTTKLLSPYVYLTGDEQAKKYIDNYYTWASNVASVDGELPPFDNSNFINLPQSASYFYKVNEKSLYGKVAASPKDYHGKNETVFKKEDLTVWLRHKEKLSGKFYHQHFSSADIIMKSKDNWWLVPPGYYKQEMNRPIYHNLPIVKERDSVWWWKIMSFLGRDFSANVSEKEPGLIYEVDTFDKIKRQVAVGDEGLIVTDKHEKKEFNVYWHVLGKLEKSDINDNEIYLVFTQEDEGLLVRLKGFETIDFKKAPHTLNKKEKEEHTVICLTGKEITSEFLLQ